MEEGVPNHQGLRGGGGHAYKGVVVPEVAEEDAASDADVAREVRLVHVLDEAVGVEEVEGAEGALRVRLFVRRKLGRVVGSLL